MFAFWLGGVVCYIGHELAEEQPLDLDTVLGGLFWPFIVTAAIIMRSES